jgi:hypothetical protein
VRVGQLVGGWLLLCCLSAGGAYFAMEEIDRRYDFSKRDLFAKAGPVSSPVPAPRVSPPATSHPAEDSAPPSTIPTPSQPSANPIAEPHAGAGRAGQPDRPALGEPAAPTTTTPSEPVRGRDPGNMGPAVEPTPISPPQQKPNPPANNPLPVTSPAAGEVAKPDRKAAPPASNRPAGPSWGFTITGVRGSELVEIAAGSVDRTTELQLRDDFNVAKYAGEDFHPQKLLRVLSVSVQPQRLTECFSGLTVTLKYLLEDVPPQSSSTGPREGQGSECIGNDTSATQMKALKKAASQVQNQISH